jgi:hypothetical protein
MHEGGKIASRKHRPPLPPTKYSWYSFLLDTESKPKAIVPPEGFCQWKFLVTPAGVEPDTFRLVARAALPATRGAGTHCTRENIELPSQSGRGQKIFPHTGVRIPKVPTLRQSLYRLLWTGRVKWMIQTTEVPRVCTMHVFVTFSWMVLSRDLDT